MSPTSQLTVTRQIAADPISTALLLAGPTALDFWPGVRRIGTVDGLVQIEAHVAEEIADALVRATPPQRTPANFVTTFSVAVDRGHVPSADGLLTLQPADREGEVMTTVTLELTSEAEISALKHGAEGFLANLAEAAERRATAA